MRIIRSVVVAVLVLVGWVGSAQAAVTVTSTNFYYSGNVGNGLTTVPATPVDVALASNGGVPFANSVFNNGGNASHQTDHLNDGLYGNTYSWIGSTARTIDLGGSYGSVSMTFAGVMLTNGSGVAAHSITGFSFGRDNRAVFTARMVGNMYIQYTTETSIDGTTNNNASADAKWTTLGYVDVVNDNDPYDHVFSISNTISPLVMTGIRIVTANGNCIDEIALYGTPGGFTTIENSSAKNVTDTMADLTATLEVGSTPCDALAYWGTVDGTNNAAGLWQFTNAVGRYTNETVEITNHVTSLETNGVLYYYTFRLTNDSTDIWASPSANFRTAGVPAVNNDGGLPNRADDSCELRGTLTNGGIATAWICWGADDGGTDSTGDWANVESVGQVSQGEAFSAEASGLGINVSYWYRCYVSNAVDAAWSDPAEFTLAWDTIYVDHSMTGGANDGAGWASAYINLDLALADTNLTPGYVQIWMAQGTYTDDATYQVTNANIQILGGFTNGMTSAAERDTALYPTILDGAGNKLVMQIQSSDVTLDGLTIRNGLSPAVSTTAGLLLYATPVAPQGFVMRNCTVENCTGSGYGQSPKGLAVSLQAGGGTVLMENCTVRNNTTPIDGGAQGVGMYATGASRLEIVDCLITNNTSGGRYAQVYGGGLHVDGVTTLVVSNTIFKANKVSGAYGGCAGAGTLVKGATDATFAGCTFDDNRLNGGGTGAGLFADTASCQIVARNCIFRGNVINAAGYAQQGAGVCAKGGATVELVNCTMVNNQTLGTAATAYGGGAVAADGATVTLVNSILEANTAAATAVPETIMARNGANVTVTYSWLDGTDATYVSPTVTLGDGVIGDVGEDPLFVAAYTDLHLRSRAGTWSDSLNDWTTYPGVLSRCIDMGSTDAPYNDYSAELDYNGGRINMGAYGGTAKASKSPMVRWFWDDEIYGTGPNSATGRCTLITTAAADVSLFWDTVNRGTNMTWAYTNSVGSQPAGLVDNLVLDGLSPDTTYYYIFYASNVNGTAWSDTNRWFVTEADPNQQVTNLAATTVNAGGIDLSWTDVFETETGYVIERKSGAGDYAVVGVAPVDASSYQDRADSGLQPDTAYTYRIAATNMLGLSLYSNEAGATTDPWDGILYVDPDKSGDGYTWDDAAGFLSDVSAHPFTHLSVSSDQIWVAQGTNVVPETALVTADGVAIYGGFTNGMTSLDQRDPDVYVSAVDGGGTKRTLWIQSSDVLLDGLTIQNGNVFNSPGAVVLFQNTAAPPTSLTIRDCTIRAGEVTGQSSTSPGRNNGVGLGLLPASTATVRVERVLLTENMPSGHSSSFGTGLYAGSFARLDVVDCTLDNNGRSGGEGITEGGGMLIENVTTAVITNTIISNNTGWGKFADYAHGGGVSVRRTTGTRDALFVDCTFRNNYIPEAVASVGNAGGAGQGLAVKGDSSLQVVLRNCAFEGNGQAGTSSGRGGAFYVRDGAGVTAVNCTFANNTVRANPSPANYRIGGGCMYVEAGSTATVVNAIIWTNTAAQGAQIIHTTNAATVNVEFSLIDSTNQPTHVLVGTGCAVNFGGGMLVGQDPLFAVPYTDLHLKSTTGRWDPTTTNWVNDTVTSPCIDAGSTAVPYGAEPDYNGERINMGRYGGTEQASKSLRRGMLLLVR